MEAVLIDIKVETRDAVSLVILAGEIDATTAAQVQQSVLPLSLPGCKILIDLAKVAYMSSAGLRMLLSVYRSVSAKQGRVVLVGLSDELQDTMSMTGFLGYFTLANSQEAGLQALA
jgi:anti-sigma B factor antagonist